jgi:hypothetical protein
MSPASPEGYVVDGADTGGVSVLVGSQCQKHTPRDESIKSARIKQGSHSLVSEDESAASRAIQRTNAARAALLER